MDQHLAFLISQAASVETEVYRVQYPDIQYSRIVPVDTSAAEYAGTITHFSMDGTGQAKFFANRGTDIPLVETQHAKHDVRVENAAIGYEYDRFELGQAMLVGLNLTADRAIVARRVAEEFIDNIVLNGQADMGWDGLMDHASVPKSDAPAGTGGSTNWASKTGLEIISDVNAFLGGVWTAARSVEIADTLLLDLDLYNILATKPVGDNADKSVMDYIMKFNIYTSPDRKPADDSDPSGTEQRGGRQQGTGHRLPARPAGLATPHADAVPVLRAAADSSQVLRAGRVPPGRP